MISKYELRRLTGNVRENTEPNLRYINLSQGFYKLVAAYSVRDIE